PQFSAITNDPKNKPHKGTSMSTPRAYTADTTAAAQVGTSNYVDESGKYIGEITLAESVTSKRGTEGIEISFLTREGQQANYLTLWTYNESSEALYGYKVLSALMTVMGVSRIEPKQGDIKDRDGNQRRVIAFPALHKVPVGLVLQKEYYTKQDGTGGYKFNIIVPFNAQTELTAKEMIDGVTQ